jgi:hypothetical protein
MCDITGCDRQVDADAPLPLCTKHLLAAYDWVGGQYGVADTLPSPCVACGSWLGVRYPSGWLCGVCEWRVGETPDIEVSAPGVDVVYYIRWGEQVKIGTSATPRGRIAALPHDEVLAFERGGRRLEQRRHLQFAQWRIPRTEWFHANPELGAHIDELRIGVEDPWSQYDRWVSRQLGLHG